MKYHQPLLKIFTILTATFLLSSTIGFGQAEELKPGSLEKLSLEDLLNVKIVSASKTNELLFDAPLSASVITKVDIQHAGSSSIMEALIPVKSLLNCLAE